MLEFTELSFAYQKCIDANRSVFHVLESKRRGIWQTDRGKYKQTEFCNMRAFLSPLDK